MIPRSRVPRCLLLGRAGTSPARIAGLRLAPRVRASPWPSSRTHSSPPAQPSPSTQAGFSTTALLRKDSSKGKGANFFDSSVDSSTGRPLSEEDAQTAADKRKDLGEEKNNAGAESAVSAKADGSNSASGQDGKAAAGGAGASSGAAPGSTDGSSGGDGGRRGRKPAERSLQKPVVPDMYPHVLAIPIARRPLFPGFYKAITIRNPEVAAAINESMKRGQSYVGAFMFKDENRDGDVIRDVNEVYDVGVFAQVTSIFPISNQELSVTAILYPHRRIRLCSLLTAEGDQASKANVKELDPKAEANATNKTEVEVPRPIPAKPIEPVESSQQQDNKKGDLVASFEESAVERKPDPPREKYDPTSFLKRYDVSIVSVENVVEEPSDPKNPNIRALTAEMVNVFKDVAGLNNIFRDQITTFSVSQYSGNIMSEPGKLADFAAAVSAGEPNDLQEILASMSIEQRMHKALIVLKNELMNARLQTKINKDVENKITKKQREYWLVEQLKGIRRELGIDMDGKEKLMEKFKEKADKLAMPDAVRKVFDEELNKLSHLETAASEFNVTRNYLDWLTQVPWGQRSAENFAIAHAVKVLDEDHYGLKDVKDRILEFIAVGKLRGAVEGKILCFVGPPGVGKTSIGKSIARALNREYYRFSVGGLTDVAEIKGHRRTYVGALPGRVIQALKKCQTENPLILIDEVDKIGRGYQGDPSSALLELLDPEQNNSFLDHYMDVPVDLSRVLFVCTANMTDTIPQPLLDRMELITLSGYVADEKKAIADKYLGPAAKEIAGLKDANVELKEEAIEELIKSYCRESGVRNLKKQIEKVYRKSALNIVRQLGEDVLPEEEALTEEGKSALGESEKKAEQGEKEEEEGGDGQATTTTTTTTKPRKSFKVPDSVHIEIDKTNLKDYVGPPMFTSDRLYDVSPPGVSMGLAWTQMGGAVLYIESILQAPLRPSTRPSLEITGNLKSVMKESTTIAYSVAKAFMAKTLPDNHFFDKAKMHLHVPDGAVPKDGPSAGITMATSLLSLAMDAAVDPTAAMTGELTLTGKVLRIGGLREKTVAARRAGCKSIIFPVDNMADWLELPQNIKEGIEGHAVGWYSEVFDLVFPGLDREQANKCKICEWKKQQPKEGAQEATKEDE
ncbi:hypothetical protein L249_8066 [Ophiocordyceps polyrhachis-furcata BCC 54312]|uniref:Lon protease homolog, mitochondrial n=1 Tax=Ophiocordyceps polyrhachis-furcata BCC 54312 TaxID=1330021 RepID=A0A367LHC5_9HYPO|nr:hypothetical protein L249_8066 [Ophiocordyceps polyrhachis-furcata BCC 54312]